MKYSQKELDSNLAHVAIELLKSDVKLDMRHFAQNGSRYFDICVPKKELLTDCGTNVCFCGFSATIIDAIPGETWWDYSLRVLGVEDDEEYSSSTFLFSTDWPDSKFQAAARALLLLKGEKPDTFDYKERYLKEISENQLINELNKYKG